MASYIIKFQLGSDVRRITLSHLLNYSQLLDFLKNIFGEALPSSYSLKYTDDEGDAVGIFSDSELEEAFRLSRESNSILRITVVPNQQPFPQENDNTIELDIDLNSIFNVLQENPFFKALFAEVPNNNTSSCCSSGVKSDAATQEVPVHQAYCDGCETGQIKGNRYKCTVCPDFDLCEECVNDGTAKTHGHSFNKISTPFSSSCPFRRGGQWSGCPWRRQRFNSACSPTQNQWKQPCRYWGNFGRCHGWNQSNEQAQQVQAATCDSCNERIVGIRFKCTTCPDYDLCAKCEEKKVHSEHSFAKIVRPSSFCGGKPCKDFTGPSCHTASPTASGGEKMEEEPLYPDITKLSINENPSQTQPTQSRPTAPLSPVAPVTAPMTTPQPVSEPVPVSVPIGKQEEPAKSVTPFEQKLKQLEEMGFLDRARNIDLLVKFSGDIVRVVKTLLDV